MRNGLCLVALISILGPLTKGALFNRPGGIFNRGEKVPTPSASISTVDAADRCVPSQICDLDAPFRSMDGSCNNLVFPMWGQAGTALTRIAPAQYEDGVNEPRKAKSGRDLPNPRRIVVEAFSFDNKVDNINTLALMSVGQLISHDASLIGASPDPPDQCCTKGGSSCFNIPVSPNDPFYEQFNVTCLPMTRAPTTAAIGCSLKPQYTLTEVSHFIDASFVYGSSDKQAADLRENILGRLKKDVIRGHSFPPHNTNPGVCFGQKPEDLCMAAGDVRVNQNPPLAALHVIFFREHNRLVSELAVLNPAWDDNRLYQEARRILIAQWQIIVYRDYLPYVIGVSPKLIRKIEQKDFVANYTGYPYVNSCVIPNRPDVALSEKLIPDLELMRDDYEELLNPSTTNDFTSAAFRISHSQISDAYCAEGGQDRQTGCPFGANDFSNSFDNPQILAFEGGFRSVLFGLDRQNADKVDAAFTVEVAGKLFRHGKPWGHDLIATDIHRGRDVGLPPYSKYRSVCGMRLAQRWRHLSDSFSRKDIAKLRSLYENVDDVDVYVAGVLEKKFGKASVGPIFECIIVDQFRRWMKGDRYFVDMKGFKHSFTPLQAKALSGTSLSRLFCDNGDDIHDMPTDIFLLTSPRVPCDKIPRVDLTPWRDAKP